MEMMSLLRIVTMMTSMMISTPLMLKKELLSLAEDRHSYPPYILGEVTLNCVCFDVGESSL